MDDTASWWNDSEVIEGSWAPFQEFESFVVSFELDLFVLFPGVFDSGDVNLDWVVDDEIDGAEGVDLLGVSAKPDHSVSHGSQVDDSRDSGEVLEDDSGRFEGDLNLFLGKGFPIQDVLNVARFYFEFITVSDGTFKQDSDTVGESFESGVVKGR